MKKTILSLAPALAAGFVLVSCENPADKTTDAKVGDVQEKLEGSGTKFVFEKSSTIGFTGSKVTGSHDGGFKEFEGHFFLGDDGVPTAGEFVIQTDSLWSDNEKLTDHLKNKDFFEVATYPTSTFALTKAVKTGDNTYDISGNLTLHGESRWRHRDLQGRVRHQPQGFRYRLCRSD
jgi:polyisoprenoid-binding protein YceI